LSVSDTRHSQEEEPVVFEELDDARLERLAQLRAGENPLAVAGDYAGRQGEAQLVEEACVGKLGVQAGAAFDERVSHAALAERSERPPVVCSPEARR
jgi:hypothetical protein